MSKIPLSFTNEARKRVFGRRIGRPLRGERKEAMETLLSKLSIEPEKVADGGKLAPSSLFANPKLDVVFEIGFGNGEHLHAMMEQSAERNYIGAEPFINGMSAFLKHIRNMRHENIRVWMDDAVSLTRSFEPESLSAIYILNPDPWPKKKHNKRRIVRAETLPEYFRALKPGGDFIMATDVDELAEWMVLETLNHGGFEWQAGCASDWKTMPNGWFRTRYEIKGEAAGRIQSYLIFKKRTV